MRKFCCRGRSNMSSFDAPRAGYRARASEIFTDPACCRGLKSRILIARRARTSRRRVRRWQRFAGGIEDELRAVLEREPDAHLLAGRNRNDGGNALPKGALQWT
jgi:hypothetical protein